MISILLSSALAIAETPIDRVVVFSDRAEITRTATGTCQADSAQVSFSSLPSSLDTRTLRSESQAGSNVVGVTSERVVLSEQYNDRVRNLLNESQRLHDLIREQQDKRSVYDTTLKQIAAYETYFYSLFQEDLRNPELDPLKWNATLNRLTNQRNITFTNINEVERKTQQLNRELSLIQKHLNKLNIQPSKQAIDAMVSINCNGLPDVSLQLFYVVPKATWQPEYDLQFTEGSDDQSDVTLTVSARISQSTGEDWNNAQIVLSTAKPTLGSEAPYPAQITVNGSLNTEEKVLVQSTEDRSVLKEAKRDRRQVASATLEDGGQSFQLTLPYRSTIASDGHQYWVPIDSQKATGTTKLVSIPRGSPKAYNAISFSNPAPYPLLDGTLSIQRNGTYMGEHQHSYTAPGEEMEISTGSAPRINIDRETLYDKRKTQMIGKNQRLQRAYQITVQNNSSEEASIEIRESIPVSKNTDIRIELDRSKTTGTYRFDEEQGFVIWSVSLPPQTTKELDLYYQIYLPESWQTQ